MKRLYAGLIAVFFLFPLSAAAGGFPWGEPNNTPDRFIVLSSYNNQAVFDSETGLVWEQSQSTSTTTWLGAHLRCNNLGTFPSGSAGNRRGWRVPTVQELSSLGDPTATTDPGLPSGHPFSNVPSGFASYWSANGSAAPFGSEQAWGVSLNAGGGAATGNKTNSLRVWCVRGGQGVDLQ